MIFPSKKQSNKIKGIILLLCLIAPIVATYTSLQYKKVLVKKEVKRQMIAGIDKRDLTLLIFTMEESQSQLQWEHSAEFEYKGRMYDVVESETKADSIYYWCWPDHEETLLNKQLNRLAAQTLGNDTQQKENHRKLIKIYKLLYYPSILNLQNITLDEHNEHSSLYTFSYSPMTFPPLIPPPKVS